MSTDTAPRVAVVFATDQGSTRDIADFIAADLSARGARVSLHDAAHAPDPTEYDVLILGSAVHDRNLLPSASAYLACNSRELTQRDVRLFTVGLGPALRGPIGRRLGRTVPPGIAAVRNAVAARDLHAFAGHYDRAGVSFRARLLYRLLGGARYGDLRDWAEIRRWSTALGDSLGLAPADVVTTHP